MLVEAKLWWALAGAQSADWASAEGNAKAPRRVGLRQVGWARSMWLPRQRLAGSLNCVQEVRYAVATTRVGPASDVIHDRGANSASLKRIQRWRKKFELMRAASYNMARAPPRQSHDTHDVSENTVGWATDFSPDSRHCLENSSLSCSRARWR